MHNAHVRWFVRAYAAFLLTIRGHELLNCVLAFRRLTVWRWTWQLCVSSITPTRHSMKCSLKYSRYFHFILFISRCRAFLGVECGKQKSRSVPFALFCVCQCKQQNNNNNNKVNKKKQNIMIMMIIIYEKHSHSSILAAVVFVAVVIVIVANAIVLHRSCGFGCLCPCRSNNNMDI